MTILWPIQFRKQSQTRKDHSESTRLQCPEWYCSRLTSTVLQKEHKSGKAAHYVKIYSLIEFDRAYVRGWQVWCICCIEGEAFEFCSTSHWSLKLLYQGLKQKSVVYVIFAVMQVDTDGSQELTAEAINKFLGDLGLEPEDQDGALILEELDIKGTGKVSRVDFLQFIRNGGRRCKKSTIQTLESSLSIDLDADRANKDPKSDLLYLGDISFLDLCLIFSAYTS